MLILAEMLRRMGFAAEAARMERVWRALYDTRRFHRLPPRLLEFGRQAGAASSWTRSPIRPAATWPTARWPTSSVSAREDEEAIQAAARRLIDGGAPDAALPPRHLVSAASYALASGRIQPVGSFASAWSTRLVSEHPPAPATLGAAQAALAA